VQCVNTTMNTAACARCVQSLCCTPFPHLTLVAFMYCSLLLSYVPPDAFRG
jgi:hypothetical protein